MPRPVKRLLREYNAQIYEKMLRKELEALAQSVDAWRAGTLDSHELTQAIHRFHQGPDRKLYTQYDSRNADFNVAYAIVTGVLDRNDIAPEVLAHLAHHLAFYEQQLGDDDGA